MVIENFFLNFLNRSGHVVHKMHGTSPNGGYDGTQAYLSSFPSALQFLLPLAEKNYLGFAVQSYCGDSLGALDLWRLFLCSHPTQTTPWVGDEQLCYSQPIMGPAWPSKGLLSRSTPGTAW